MISLEEFEELAEEFYRDTGMMAPGKDTGPVAPTHTHEERREAYAKWYRGDYKTPDGMRRRT